MEKRRLHPNFFDILFLVLILAVAVVAYLLSHSSDTRGKEVITRTYRLELEYLQEDMADCVAVGDAVTDNIQNYDLGTVTAMEVVPYTASVNNEEAGTVDQVPVEGYISLWLTVEVDTVETDSAITTVSGYDLRTGKAVSCSVGMLTSAGYILAVEE